MALRSPEGLRVRVTLGLAVCNEKAYMAEDLIPYYGKPRPEADVKPVDRISTPACAAKTCSWAYRGNTGMMTSADVDEHLKLWERRIVGQKRWVFAAVVATMFSDAPRRRAPPSYGWARIG